jgi:hypothetical protein
MKNGEMDWHKACMGMNRSLFGVLRGNLRERDHLNGTGVDGWTRLKLIFRNLDKRAWTGLSSLRTGRVSVGCKHGKRKLELHKMRWISRL